MKLRLESPKLAMLISQSSQSKNGTFNSIRHHQNSKFSNNSRHSIINQLTKMIQDGLINKFEGVQILQKFFQSNCSFQAVGEAYRKKNRTLPELTNFIKSKFRELLLQVQYHLCRMKYISQLKIYDHASPELFDELIQMHKFLPEKHFQDFVFEEKSKYLCVEKSSSRKRMEMYKYFLEYAEKHKLFNVLVPKEERNFEKGPFENPNIILTGCEQELICFLYEVCQADYKQIGKKLQQFCYNDSKFKGQKLHEILNNLEYIGLYRCYRKSMKSLGGKGMRWEEFVKEQHHFRFPIEEWEVNIKILLIRIAIRDDANTQHIRNVCWYMNRRFDDKPLVEIPKGYHRPSQNTRVSTPEINKLRADLLSVLHGKIWFNEVNLTI